MLRFGDVGCKKTKQASSLPNFGRPWEAVFCHGEITLELLAVKDATPEDTDDNDDNTDDDVGVKCRRAANAVRIL